MLSIYNGEQRRSALAALTLTINELYRKQLLQDQLQSALEREDYIEAARIQKLIDKA